jgi:hypothetical protein
LSGQGLRRARQSPGLNVPTITALSFLPGAVAKALIVRVVRFAMIGASYTGELSDGWE